MEHFLLQSKLCAEMGDFSCDQFLLDLVNGEACRFVSEEHCKGFPVHVEGSVNLNVVSFPHELYAVLN